MSKAWKWAPWLVLLIAISGCETTPSSSHYKTPLTLALSPSASAKGMADRSAGNQGVPFTTVTISNEMEIAPAAPLVAPPLTTTPTQTPWPATWVNVWIPLEAWGKYNGLEKFSVVKSNPHPYYQFATARGAVSVKAGTRVAFYNGLECWLGFAPQVINGIPCVHWLDAQKVLQPLLTRFQFPFQADAGVRAPNGTRTIVIDPGHGGVDSGTISVFNYRNEKEYTLDWGLRLAGLLQTNGWKVVLTRRRDMELSLNERIAIADRAKADLFLSLHFNSGVSNHELAGIETYCLTPTGMPSSLLRNHEDDLGQIFPNNAYDEQNFQLALRLHRGILQSTDATDRGLRRARFMSVLRGQNRPAVLIEGGYLSNANEARKIATPEYRQKLAEAVARGVMGEE